MRLICLLFALSLYVGSFGQNFTGGGTVGLIASTINGDTFGGFRQAGLMAGGYVQYPINNFLNFQPEILFEMLGSRAGNGPQGLRTNYVSLPLLLNANLSFAVSEKTYRLGFDLGPSVGYLLSAKDLLSDLNTTDTYRRLDYKLVGGIVFGISEKLQFTTRASGSIISFFPRNLPRNNCFGNLPQFCHYYITFALRYQLINQ